MTAAVIVAFLALIIGIPTGIGRRNARVMTDGLRQPDRCGITPPGRLIDSALEALWPSPEKRRAQAIAPLMACPLGGECSRSCDRTQGGCDHIWGPADEHTRRRCAVTPPSTRRPRFGSSHRASWT